MKFAIPLTLLLLTAPSVARAESLEFAGVLGNSGEAGATLVRFSEQEASGMGVVYDRFGTLWDRGGAGRLNRYALDGRLVASYPLPDPRVNRNADSLALAGDHLLLRLDQGVYSLPIDAPSGTAPKSLGLAAQGISRSARDGWVAVATKDEILLVNAAGEKQPFARVRNDFSEIDFGPDGRVYGRVNDRLLCVRRGADALAPAGQAPGDRIQFLDGYWYGATWHSTLRRFDAALNPDPGVVLGGNSGAFIGHVDEQAELVNGRGITQIHSELFAISGLSGVVHLLHWSEAERRFAPIRRLGAVRECNALGLDAAGRIWHAPGAWKWTDDPAAPLRFGIPHSDVVAAALLNPDVMVAYGRIYEKPGFFYGKLSSEVRSNRIENEPLLPDHAVAIAPFTQGGRNVALLLEASGKGVLVQLGGDGKFEKVLQTLELRVATPVARWTSLCALGDDRLIGAADGFVIELSRERESWSEVERWNHWGDLPTEKFGGAITIAHDAGRLWIADAARHRVLVFGGDRTLLASYGAADSPGDALLTLDFPTTLAARGARAVVFDRGNQRLVKLELRR